MDSPVTVIAVWRRNGIMLTSSPTRMILDTTLINNSSMYLAQVVFSPIQLSTDDGVYTCAVAVGTELNDFVKNSILRSSNIIVTSNR